MTIEGKPNALVVYYSFSQQTGKVAAAMAACLAAQGFDVERAAIEFTDPKWAKRFSTVPMRFPALQIPTILIAQRMRKTGEIRIPGAAREGVYDLVVIGSPTWWLTTNMPIRSYLKSSEAKRVLDGTPFAAFSVSRRYYKGNMKDVRELGEICGGAWVDETHFTAAGGQVTSMLSWLAYMKHGTARERILGVRMPPPNLKPDFEQQARSFIARVVAPRPSRTRASAGT